MLIGNLLFAWVPALNLAGCQYIPVPKTKHIHLIALTETVLTLKFPAQRDSTNGLKLIIAKQSLII